MTKNAKIVLIVVGVCCTFGLTILLILAALVIPAAQATIRHANETSAIDVLKLINTEEQAYNMTYPQRGYACSLTALGGSPQSGAPTADSAQLIPDDVASGHKAGYAFAIGKCVKGKDRVLSYEVTAVPNAVGHTGNRGFCIDQDGSIRFDPKGGTDCTGIITEISVTRGSN